MPRSDSSHPLPAPRTSLVGREKDVDALYQLLSPEGQAVRLLMLTGAAGSGKTRLAIGVGTALAATYPNGVGWVDLSLVTDERLVAQTVVTALQLTTPPQNDAKATLVAHLQPTQFLLILDNCEHVINGCVDLVQTILDTCPQVQILATSRETLKIPGETIWLTPLLAVPQRGTMPPFEELLSYPGIRLWVERAQAAYPEFRLTQDNALAVVQVCQRLDGMPLAIELAAARVKVLSVEQIAERLDDRFRLLRATMRTVLPRNQTLRATIDWSYALLSDNERVLLQYLAVFVGGSSLDTVEFLVADEPLLEGDGVLDVLTRLVEKSLVIVQRDAPGTRYVLLETIRQYALEKLQDAARETDVRRRHRDWALQCAQALSQGGGHGQQNNWLTKMDAEYENFQAAMDWCAHQTGEARVGLRLACLMRQYWDSKGYVHEAHFYLHEMLTHPENSAPTAVRAEALNYLGFFTLLHGDAVTATTYYHHALGIGEELQDLSAIALACSGLVFVMVGSIDPHQAEPYIRQGLDAARKINDSVRIYSLLYYASWLAMAQGDYRNSHDLLSESLDLMRAAKDTNLTAAALWRLGHIYWLEGLYPQSLVAFQESLTLRQSINNQRGVAYAIDGVAWVAAALAEHQLAARLFGAADRHFTVMDTHFHPLEQPAHDAALALTSTALESDIFDAAWERGKHLTLEDAANLALKLTAQPLPVAQEVMQEIGPGSAPATNPTLLSLYALGETRVVLGNRTIAPTEWTYSRAQELLFFLATEGPATREQIGLIFWPDASPDQLRRNLGVMLHHLRKTLGRKEWVVYEKGMYNFNRTLGHWYDAEEFTILCQQARQHPNPKPLLQQALALYQGEFLAGLKVRDWYVAQRDFLAHQYEESLFALAQSHWNGGEYPAAAAVYRQAINHDPYLEAAYRELMRCLVQMGERAQALRVYTDLAHIIKQEFASLPSQETQELVARLRAG